MKIAYLGPVGSFSEQAGLYFSKDSDEKFLFSSFADIIEAVSSGQVDSGIVPIENSLEGSVTEVLDALIFEYDLFIHSELNLRISQALLAKPNENKAYKTIVSHPQALAQCRSFLRKNYPLLELVKTQSTSEAAKIVQESDGTVLAIGNINCAKHYNLTILQEDIQDRKNNITKFIQISNKKNEAFETCKTSLAFSTLNKPGELYKILDIFSLWDLNLTKIESRPSKEKMGEYVFFVDIDGISDTNDIYDALSMVERKTSMYKNMGFYKTFI